MTLQKLYKNWEKIARAIIIIEFALIVIIQGLYMVIDGIYFKSGETMTAFESAKKVLKQENLSLTDAIATSSSLRAIEDKSGALGFRDKGDVKWIK